MSRIRGTFARTKAENRPALVAYIMAGDPDLATSEKLALACIRGGTDILELGVPFSDPIADGPEIQAAGQRALRAGTRPRDVLNLAARLRRETDVPLVLMTYLNPVLATGTQSFAERAASAGVDGLIVPDLPLEESAGLRDTLDGVNTDLIQLVAPSTPPERAERIGAASRGFLYVVARYGTTGVRAGIPPELGDRLATLRRVTSMPLAVGFGVSTADHVRALRSLGADGVVVGSAIVSRIGESPRPESVEAFVAGLAAPPRP